MVSLDAAPDRPQAARIAGMPRGLALLLILATLTRLAAAAAIPLTEDEAYYRLWSQHLSLGYYDHPPMMAWWIAAGRALLGDTPLADRLLAVFATTVTSLLVYRIAGLSGLSDKIAARAAVFYNATLLVGFGGHLIVPDGPSTLFWTSALFALLKARGGEGAAGRLWWLAAGAAAGLAVLSKYSALFLAPGVVLWLASSPRGRAMLATPWPWLAAAAAAALCSLNIFWNAGHGWVSFEKQFGRAAPQGLTPRHLLELLATQAILFNPLLTPLAVFGVAAAWRRRAQNLDGLWLVAAVSAPFGAYLLLHSLHAGVQGHWPAPLYPGLAVLAAAATDTAGRRRHALAVWAPRVGLAVSAFALAHLSLPTTDWFGRWDMAAQIRGWPEFAEEVEEIRAHVGANWVGSVSFGQAALLANERRSAAPIVQITERSRYQYEPGPPAALMAGPGLVVDYSRRVTASDLSQCFGEVWPLGEITRGDRPDAAPATGDPDRLGLGRSGLGRLGLGPRRFSYALFRVARPKVDLIRDGCWESKTLADSLAAKARRNRH